MSATNDPDAEESSGSRRLLAPLDQKRTFRSKFMKTGQFSGNIEIRTKYFPENMEIRTKHFSENIEIRTNRPDKDVCGDLLIIIHGISTPCAARRDISVDVPEAGTVSGSRCVAKLLMIVAEICQDLCLGFGLRELEELSSNRFL